MKPSEELQLAPPETTRREIPVRQDPAALAIIKLMESPDALKNVEALEKLADLYLKLGAADAEKQFAAAFVAMQAEMPTIRAVKPVMNKPEKGGGVRYVFAPFEDIMEQVTPLLKRHEFTVSFSSEFREGRVIQTCTLQHVGGHKRSNSFGARVGQGPPGASDAQGDGAASTYAKRFALCDALNIVIEKDNDGQSPDARVEGAPITRDKIQYLKEQCAEVGSTEAGMLALAGVSKFEDISDAVYPVLIRAIEARRRAKK